MRTTDCEENKELLIASTDAVVDPRTMMIHLFNASITYAAATTQLSLLLLSSVECDTVLVHLTSYSQWESNPQPSDY